MSLVGSSQMLFCVLDSVSVRAGLESVVVPL